MIDVVRCVVVWCVVLWWSLPVMTLDNNGRFRAAEGLKHRGMLPWVLRVNKEKRKKKRRNE